MKSTMVPQALAIGAAGAIGYYGSRYIIRNRRLKANGSRNLEIVVSPDSPLKSIINKIQHFKEDHTRPFFLFNGHVETILAAWFRSDPPVRYHRECIIMADRGAVALDWPLECDGVPRPPESAPIVLLFPGLTGGSHDSYVKHFVANCWRQGLRAVVFNSRGTSDSPVTTPQFYSASFTGDTKEVVKYVTEKCPDSDLLAVGWSLGANILTRYLGEAGEATPIRAAASLVNPFDLTISDRNFETGFNRIYDKNLAKALRTIFARHAALFEDLPPPYQPALAARCETIREFDDALTRVSFGWPDVDAYYAGSSSSLSIPQVRVPLLCVSARDDPIAPYEAIPFEAIRKNPHTGLIVTPTGGHLAWVAGASVSNPPWPDKGVIEFLRAALKYATKKRAEEAKAAAAAAQKEAEAQSQWEASAAAAVKPNAAKRSPRK